MRYLYIIVFTVLLISPGCKQSTEITEKIQRKELIQTISYLASPELNGRLAGSTGYNEAAEFVASKFSEYGLEDLGFDNYYQNLKLEYNSIEECSFSKIISKDSARKYELGEDYVCRGFSGSGNIKAPVVFCGYGISDQNANYNDYKNVDVDGKIVMQFKADPNWKIDQKNIGYNSLRKKALLAKQNGAIGIIFVSRPNQKNPQKPIGSVMHGKGKQLVNFPQIHVDLKTANDFFEHRSITLSELQKKIDKEKQPQSVNLHTQAHIFVKALYKPKKASMNVAGMVPAQNKNADEYIVLGAHLDHVGEQAGKIYFPGANDNASGVASLLEVAEAFSVNKPKNRSIIFVAFTAEESGLIGASHFVENSPVELNKIHAMLNMDCIGHGDSVVVGGGKSAPALYDIVRKKDSLMENMVINRTWHGGGADATPFYEKGVSTLYFATKNSYTHLHLLSDKPNTINKELHQYITRLIYKTASEMAQ
jgi:hypothetical protein